MVFLEMQYQLDCYLKKLKLLFNLERLAQKGKMCEFNSVQMNTLPIIGTVLKEKTISHAQKIQAEEFHA